MNDSSLDGKDFAEKALNPLEREKLKVLSEVQLHIFKEFFQYALEKHLYSKGCISTDDCSVALDEFDNSGELKAEILLNIIPKWWNFSDVENVLGDISQATTMQEIHDFREKFDARKFRLNKRVEIWLNRNLYRKK